MMDYILNIQMTARETADAIDRLQTREDISFFYKRAGHTAKTTRNFPQIGGMELSPP